MYLEAVQDLPNEEDPLWDPIEALARHNKFSALAKDYLHPQNSSAWAGAC